MKHTAEPWRVEDETDVVAIVDQWPSVIADCLNHAAIERRDAAANARRIAACVNACAGISDEALDSWMNPPEGGFGHPHGPWPAHIISLQRAAETLKQQRDELLATMQYLRQHKLWANSHAKAVIASAVQKVGAGGTAPEGHNLNSTTPNVA